jgi:GrpB-like predicted nucleotidyltransferase (UPF0157 family)
VSIHIEPYSEAWSPQFAVARDELPRIFQGHATGIEHIGSTAVPGLCAKPIINVLLGAQSLADIEAKVPDLRVTAYQYVRQHEVALPERRYLVKAEAECLPVRLHGVCKGSQLWAEYLGFRNALLASTEARDAYATFKQELARL